MTRIWEAQTGRLLHSLTSVHRQVRAAAWAEAGDGRLLLATGHADGFTTVWDGRTGDAIRSIYARGSGDPSSAAWAEEVRRVPADNEDSGEVTSVAWAALPDGQLLLAIAYSQFQTQVWRASNFALVEQPNGSDQSGPATSVSWAVLSDGRLLLATGNSSGQVQIRDGHTGALRRSLTEASGQVYSVAFAVLPGDRVLLATGGSFTERTTRIWDGLTYERLASLPGARGEDGSLAWAVTGDGPVLLAATPGLSRRRARIWAVEGGPASAGPAPGRSAAEAGATRPVRYRALNPLLSGLLTLGRAELWPPLGLIDDLIAVTGPGASIPPDLNDGRVAALAPHPGIQRLRDLAWPATARLSFAALLASRLSLSAGYLPPASEPEPVLRAALSQALAQGGPAVPSDLDLSQLRAAADTVSDELVALLTVLGPGATAADPLLPLRLAHHAARMPALTPRQANFLTELAQRGPSDRRRSDGGLRHAPGTAGVGRRGSLTQLLSTQLALPARLLTIRYLQQQLLYRRHTVRVPPSVEPVTLIVDSTPPTYGPAETVLRLTAHLLTMILWEHGQHPVVISLTEPGVATPLTSRAQLARLWTTRTLDPPGPAITAALQTAADAGTRQVLLAHHYAPEHRYLPGPARRLLTTHQPPEPAPPPPAHPDHYHLPADPDQELLVETAWALLRPAGERA